MEHLQNRDFTMILDRSGSMGYPVSSTDKRSRWKACGEATVMVARKLNEFDPDGITVYDFDSKFTRYDNTDETKVAEIFAKKSPGTSTALHLVLGDAVNNFLSRKAKGETKANGELMVVVTDGEPDDKEAVARVIVNATKKLDNKNELSIILIQVGDDQSATRYLKSLDDDLEKQGAKYDIVSVLAADKIGDKPVEDVLLEAITEAKIH